jgi:hypothetical protein
MTLVVLGIVVAVLAVEYMINRFWSRCAAVGIVLTMVAAVFDLGGMVRRVSLRYQENAQWAPAIRDGAFALMGEASQAKPYVLFCVVGLAVLSVHRRRLSQLGNGASDTQGEIGLS